MEIIELKESKGNKEKKERKNSKESKESKKKKKDIKSKKDKKSKGKKNDKEKKSKSEINDPNKTMFLNKKIKLLEEQLKDKTNNLNNIDNFNISLKNTIHILNYHENWVFCLSILNDGRLISGSYDNSIIIYNKATYQPD